MTGIALRRSAKRTLAQIEIQPRRKFVNRVRQDGSIPPGVDDGSESVFEEDETEDGSSSPDSPESPKSPDSPTSEAPFPIQPPATSLNLPPPRPTDTIRLNPPQAETTRPATTTTAVRPPPPPPITTAAPVVSPPTVRPSLPVVVTTTTPPPAGGPTTTLVPIAPPQSPPVVTRPTRATTIRDPARESGDSSTETALPPTVAPPAGGPTTTLTPIAPPRTTGESSTLTLDSTATSTDTTTTSIESPTTSQASATTTQVTTRFVISSTGLNNGVPTTVLITLPNGSETTFSTRLSTTSTRRVSTTTSAGFIPSESVIIPSSISALPTSKPETNIEGSTRQSTIGVGGVAALSIVIALASIATIVFVVYKCCWPQRLRDRPLSGSTAFGPIRKFWQKPRSAASRGGGDDSLPGHAQPQMAHVRPDGKIMDQVMAAAYEAEQGNAGVYGRYADRHRASWHTDDSSILEEKQRQYEAAVAASAINGTPPPPVTQGRALQLGQMMGAFLKDKHDKPKPAEAEMPRSPAGTTSGPTAFMPKDHRVEWSWRVSVGDQFRRASQNLRSEDGFWSKAAKGFKK